MCRLRSQCYIYYKTRWFSSLSSSSHCHGFFGLYRFQYFILFDFLSVLFRKKKTNLRACLDRLVITQARRLVTTIFFRNIFRLLRKLVPLLGNPSPPCLVDHPNPLATHTVSDSHSEPPFQNSSDMIGLADVPLLLKKTTFTSYCPNFLKKQDILPIGSWIPLIAYLLLPDLGLSRVSIAYVVQFLLPEDGFSYVTRFSTPHTLSSEKSMELLSLPCNIVNGLMSLVASYVLLYAPMWCYVTCYYMQSVFFPARHVSGTIYYQDVDQRPVLPFYRSNYLR